MADEPMDDLDRLYARLEPLPLPADFVVHVMTQVRRQEARARRRRFAGWLVADLVAALVLGWAAFSVGRVLALGAFDQGAVELLFDLDLALAAPLPWLIAIGELAPVVAFVCLIAAGAVVAVATRALLSGAARGARVI